MKNPMRKQRHVRPGCEVLEHRIVPAVGLFFENFASDLDPSQPGWDSWDADPATLPPGADELWISNDFPGYPATSGPARYGAHAAIEADPFAPYGSHVLRLIPGEGHHAVMEFWPQRPGFPGGPAHDEEVAAVGIDLTGFGAFIVYGANGNVRGDVITSANEWKHFSATRNTRDAFGREIGPIVYVVVAADKGVEMQVNRLGFLVYPTERPLGNVVANDDHALVSQRQTNPSAQFNWRQNDVDLDGDPIRLLNHTLPQHGRVDMDDATGTATYYPNHGYLGRDSFSYEITDGKGNVDSADVILDVTNNAPPVATGGKIVADHGAPAPLRGSIAYAEADGDPVTVTIEEGPHHGVVTPSIVDGRVHFEYATPSGRVIGPDAFTYRLFDGVGYSDVERVEIRVPNYAPVAIPDRFAFHCDVQSLYCFPLDGGLDPDRPDRLLGALAGDSQRSSRTMVWGDARPPVSNQTGFGFGFTSDFDLDGDRLTFDVVHQPLHGFLVDFNGGTGDFTYQLPNPPLFPQRDLTTGAVLKDDDDADGDGDLDEDLPWVPYGFDWFTYRVSDGHSTSDARVLIEIRPFFPGADAALADRVWPINDAYVVAAGHELVMGFSFLTNDAQADHELFDGPHVVEGPSGALEFFDGFRYQPNAGFVGVDQLRYQVHGGGHPTWVDLDVSPYGFWTHRNETIHSANVSFIVLNTPPDPMSDHFRAVGDQPLVISGDHGLLVNDHDFNGHNLRVDFISDPPNGEILASGDQGGFTYQPDPGFHGRDTFNYQVSDGFGGTALATITIEVADPVDTGDVENLVTPTGHRIVLASSAGTTLEQVSVTATPPSPPPAGVTFPLGFVQFEVHGVPRGGSATVRVILPQGAPAMNDYWKFGPTLGNPTPHWYSFNSLGIRPTGADFNPGDILLHFVDGGHGDASGADGVIVDPGGPAYLATPRITGIVLHDGSPQRSKIDRITIAYSDVVTVDPGAIEVLTARGKRVPLRMAIAQVGDHTVATLIFKGKDTLGGSLIDGQYSLKIHGDKIHNGLGVAVDGNGDGQPGGVVVEQFFRRFGDTDGDGDLDGADHARLLAAMGRRRGKPGYVDYLDYDANGKITSQDLVAFLVRKKLMTQTPR